MLKFPLFINIYSHTISTRCKNDILKYITLIEKLTDLVHLTEDFAKKHAYYYPTLSNIIKTHDRYWPLIFIQRFKEYIDKDSKKI